MRLPIFKPEDFFGYPEDPFYLHLESLTFEPELPLCYFYRYQIPPLGKAVDIQVDIEANTITCALEFFPHASDWGNLAETEDGYLIELDAKSNRVGTRYRLGGFYTNFVPTFKEGGKKWVEDCILREVSLIPEPAWPMCESDAAGRGNPRVQF